MSGKNEMQFNLNRMLLAHIAELEKKIERLNHLNGMKRYSETDGRLDQTWLILSGDWYGSIYLTVPYGLVGPEARINELLWTMFDIDHNYPDHCVPEPAHAALIHTDRPQKGESHWIDGQLKDTLWLCDKFANRSVLSHMLEVHGGCVISHFETWAENGIRSTRDELRQMSWEEFARHELDLRI